MKLVRVDWEDITTFSKGWIEIAHAKEFRPMQMSNVGWVVDKNKERVTLTSQIVTDKDDNRCGDVVVILVAASFQ